MRPLDEITRREQQAIARRIRRAQFESLQAALESVDFAAALKLAAAQIRDLAALESVIAYGSVGVGMIHFAQVMVHPVSRCGAGIMGTFAD